MSETEKQHKHGTADVLTAAMQKNPSDLGFVDGDVAEDDEVISGSAREALKTVADDIIEEEPDLFDDEEEDVWGGPQGFDDMPEEAQVAPPTQAPVTTDTPQMAIAIPSVMGHKTHFSKGDPIDMGKFNAEGITGGSGNIADIKVNDFTVDFVLDNGDAIEWHGPFAVHKPSGYTPEGGK